MKIETVKRRQQIEQKRLRETILQELDQLETDSSELAVRNALRALDAQYAEAHRTQVALEDVLPDGVSLEAALYEGRELCKEVFTTRTRADTFLKEKDESKEPVAKPALTEKSQLGKLQPVPLPKFDGRSDAPQSIPSSARGGGESHVEGGRLEGVLWDGAAELTMLHDDLNCHFLELRALVKDVDANLSGFYALLPMIKKKLPPDTLEAWRAFVQELTNEQITSAVFLSFLLSQSQIKSSARKMTAQKPERRVARDSSNSPGRNDGNVSGNMDCVLDVCEQGTVEGAASRILINQVSILCLPRRTPTVEKSPTTASAQGSEAEDGAFGRAATELAPVGVYFSSTVRAPGVLLPVVQAMAHGENGKKRLVNCLLDSASEKSLIRTHELELSGTPSAVTVRGVHGLSARVADSRHVRFQLALCISSICDDLVATLTPWPHEIDLPRTATLATPPSLTSIHVLIGFDMYYRVLGRGLRVAGEDDPIAMETIFGWILCGPKARCSAGKQETTMVLTKILGDRFDWVVQEAETNPDEDVKRKFSESVTFDGTRYVVGLLWRAGVVQLPDNREVAMRRLRALRRQLNRDPEKDQEYAGVIRDYLDRGWAEKVNGASGPPGRTWYLPHHAVYQHNQGKMKCRVVFDGSAKWNGTSLNSCLDPGPKLQPDLVALLLRFR
ncbi:hypothetical protein T01_8694 [Trichinella spiralis]|uniref:Peptidase aspartic putative domain-containing protein n=1 Tax=Trichinella spiralis TaxID=6334 RepID=A0A0V1ARC0_TRISP|nr:hypothetical protein T01_8694 [Trichinella spiralis]